MTIANTTSIKAAFPLPNTAPLALLDPMVDAGTRFLFDFTNANDCVDAIAVGALANGAVAHNLVAGGAPATVVDDGSKRFALLPNKAGLQVAAVGAAGTVLDLGTGYDLSANPMNEWLELLWFKVPAAGFTTNGFALLGDVTAIGNVNAAQWMISTAAGGLSIAITTNGLAADGATAKVAQITQAAALTPGTIACVGHHWSPQRQEFYLANLGANAIPLINQAAGVNVPYEMKPFAGDHAYLHSFSPATFYRAALHDLTAGGTTAAVKIAQEFAFFSQRLVDLGIS